MNLHTEPAPPESVLAQIPYTADTGEKLINETFGPTNIRRRASGTIEWRDVNIANGRVKEQNFDDYRMLRMNETPEIEVYVVDSTEKPGGMGEPAVALVAPAVCNAIYAATRKRIRALPIAKQGFVV